jgi:hypothetical protein
MLELAEFRTRERFEISEPQKRIVTSVDSGEAWCQSHRTVVAMVAIIEEFVVARMKAIIESRDLTDDEIVSEALGMYSNRIEQNWDNRIKVSKEWFNIDLKREASFIHFQAFVDARNSIVHGNGKVTRRQASNDESRSRLVQRLMSVGIDVQDSYLHVSEHAVEICASSGIDFIVLFDWKSKALLAT